MKEDLEQWNQQQIGDNMAHNQIKWIFSPTAAPHFGGAWERLVQSAKKALRIILKNRSMTEEVLSTAFIEVENLINGRPLTHVSVDPNDPEPLTSNHFIPTG